METPEQLRESLQQTTRLKEQAERYRMESELLLKGIQHTLSAESTEAMYAGMFDIFGQLIPYEDCFVLQGSEPGVMKCTACAHQRFIDTEWPLGPVLKRVLSGHTLTTFRLDNLKEWQVALAKPSSTAKSALYCPVPIQHETAVLVLTSDKVGAFSKSDEALAARFMGLTSQTLESVSSRLLQLEAQQLRSDKEKAEAGLMQAEKMASVGQLAAGVAHEINNPVSFLLGNTSALSDYVKDLTELLDVMEPMMADGDAAPDLGSCKERLGELRRLWAELDISYIREDMVSLLSDNRDGLDRVKEIVQALRSFSRQDSGEWAMGDINEGLALTVRMVENEFRHKADLQVDLQPIPDINCQIGRLNQVWMNLIINAGQALGDTEQGVIKVASCVRDRCVVVTVEDNGCGISPDALQRLFEPFYTTKPLGEGTGLGLSISYGIVEQHGGRIEVESRINQGTRFIVYLPMGEEQEAQA